MKRWRCTTAPSEVAEGATLTIEHTATAWVDGESARRAIDTTCTATRPGVPMFGFIVSILVYPFAVWWLRRFLRDRLGMEQNVGVLVFLLASIVSWAAAEVAGRL